MPTNFAKSRVRGVGGVRVFCAVGLSIFMLL
jgi:hypothetical protein